jgi:hypothetical protein
MMVIDQKIWCTDDAFTGASRLLALVEVTL